MVLLFDLSLSIKLISKNNIIQLYMNSAIEIIELILQCNEVNAASITVHLLSSQ